MVDSPHPGGRGVAGPGVRWRVRGALELLRLHVEALFTCDSRGRLVRVNEPGGAVAPRFFVGVCPEGVLAWYRDDLAAELVSDLAELCESLEPGRGFGDAAAAESAFVRRLAASSPVTRTSIGPAFTFPEKIREAGPTVRVTVDTASLLEPRLPEWLEDVRDEPPCVAVVEGGEAVSICCSVRITDRAHEAGVETHPDFRGRGYAGRATAAWARLVRERGAVPLYSTSSSNAASRAVARKLGLIQFSEDLHVT